MALIDIIKYDATKDEEVVQKFIKEEIKLGSQLIVNQAQDAIFVRSGEVFDTFGPGTHTLSTANIPLLNKVVNLPFGGLSPFSAEVWFVNKTTKRNLKWGTKNPIPIIDPKLGFPISLRAFGKWGYEIVESKSFLRKLVGTLNKINANTIENFFETFLMQNFSDITSELIIKSKFSIFEINSQLNELSFAINQSSSDELIKYGIKITNFDIANINIPSEEKKKIQEVLAKKMEIEQISKAEISHAYTVMRSFDTMEKAAENEGGSAGQLMGAGLGLGLGFGAGAQAGKNLGENLSVENTKESSNTQKTVSHEDRLMKIKNLLDKKLIDETEYKKLKQKILDEI